MRTNYAKQSYCLKGWCLGEVEIDVPSLKRCLLIFSRNGEELIVINTYDTFRLLTKCYENGIDQPSYCQESIRDFQEVVRLSGYHCPQPKRA